MITFLRFKYYQNKEVDNRIKWGAPIIPTEQLCCLELLSTRFDSLSDNDCHIGNVVCFHADSIRLPSNRPCHFFPISFITSLLR